VYAYVQTTTIMFSKFDYKQDVIGQNPIKSSVQRSIRKKILEQYPQLESYLEQIFPKKKDLVVTKCAEHIELILIDHEILFFKGRDDPYFPTLTLVHRCKLCTEDVR
jgi:malignant T-cell-amplified sequence